MSIEMSQSSSVVTGQSTPKAMPCLSQECQLQEFDFLTTVSRKLKDSLPVMTSSRGGCGSLRRLEAVHLTSPAIIEERRLKQQQKEKMADEKEKRAADRIAKKKIKLLEVISKAKTRLKEPKNTKGKQSTKSSSAKSFFFFFF